MKKRTEPLMPRFRAQIKISKPANMDKMIVNDDEREMLERLSLSIFTDCSNSGLSFRDSLVSILLSGMDWGINANKIDK